MSGPLISVVLFTYILQAIYDLLNNTMSLCKNGKVSKYVQYRFVFGDVNWFLHYFSPHRYNMCARQEVPMGSPCDVAQSCLKNINSNWNIIWLFCYYSNSRSQTSERFIQSAVKRLSRFTSRFPFTWIDYDDHCIVSREEGIVTARKRSLRRLCFYTCLSVILFTGEGSTWAGTPPGTRYTPRTGTPPRTRCTLRDQVHPQGRYTPWDQVYPPGPGTPPGRGTPPGTWYTPQAGTPPGTRYTSWAGKPPGTRYPQNQGHPTSMPPRDQVHPPEECMLGDTGNKRAGIRESI